MRRSEEIQEQNPEPVKLERQTSASVDLGSGVSIDISQNTRRVTLLRRGEPKPLPSPTSVTVSHDGIETTAQRTPIGMEPLVDLLDDFPDSIRETITRVLEK